MYQFTFAASALRIFLFFVKPSAFFDLHRSARACLFIAPGQGVNLQPVMGHLLYLVPFKPRRVLDRFLKAGIGCAVGDHVEPVAIPLVFGHPSLVWSEQYRSRGCREPLHLNEPEFP